MKTKQAVNLTAGDCVYFRKCQRGTKNVFPEIGFAGHGFGIMLGIVPTNQKEPGPLQLFQMMGKIGFISFDAINEFLGEEVAKNVIEKFQDKYYGKEIPPELVQKEVPSTLQPSTKILDENGNQLNAPKLSIIRNEVDQ